MKRRICTIVGIRPDFIRLSHIIKLLDNSNDIEHILLHTGQHLRKEMSIDFFNEFGLREPDYNLEISVDTNTAMEQIGKLIPSLDNALQEIKPDLVVYLGDTNTAVSAFVPARLGIPICRIEAGMRAYDRHLPEEHNRKCADSLADLKICYINEYKMQLILEGHEPESCIVTGNPIVDIVNWGLNKYNIIPKNNGYTLATFHRANNILCDDTLKYFVSLINNISSRGESVIFSCYYRTADRINELDIKLDSSIEVCRPSNFGDFLRLEAEADIIMTDSGTSQEESFLLGSKCMVLRDATERPETLIQHGGNAMFWTKNMFDDLETYYFLKKFSKQWDKDIYGSGNASQNIVDAIINFVNNDFKSEYGINKYVIKRYGRL